MDGFYMLRHEMSSPIWISARLDDLKIPEELMNIPDNDSVKFSHPDHCSDESQGF
jgi:hypothetical protein